MNNTGDRVYIFFHLITGIIIGLLMGDLLHDRRWLVPCAIGSILPDLFDKPLGYILLPDVIGYGRSLFHSLLVFNVLFIIGLVLWIYRRSAAILAIDIGILSHQILDMMWREPVNWLDPILGPYTVYTREPMHHLLLLLIDEISNPSEWFLGAVIGAGVIAYLQKDRVLATAREHRRGFRGMLEGLGIALWMISVIVFTYGLVRIFLMLPGRVKPDEYAVISFVIALGAFLVWRWGSSLRDKQQDRKIPIDG
jgi:membrane-bound metal-dependent hydrolase YbcI (DUF457 family)